MFTVSITALPKLNAVWHTIYAMVSTGRTVCLGEWKPDTDFVLESDVEFVRKFAHEQFVGIIIEYLLPSPAVANIWRLRTTDLGLFQWLWCLGDWGVNMDPSEVSWSVSHTRMFQLPYQTKEAALSEHLRDKDATIGFTWGMSDIRQFQWLCQVGAVTEDAVAGTLIIPWAILHEDVETFRWARARTRETKYITSTFISGFRGMANHYQMTSPCTSESDEKKFMCEMAQSHAEKLHPRYWSKHWGRAGGVTPLDPGSDALLQMLPRLGMDMQRVLRFEWPMREEDFRQIVQYRHQYGDCISADRCTHCTYRSCDADRADAARWVREMDALGPLPGGIVIKT